MCVEAGVPVALSSDAHRPEDVGADYERALELLDAARRRRAVRCSSGARAGWSRSARARSGCAMTLSGSAMTPTASPPGGGSCSAASRSRTSAASTGTPTPTCSRTRVIDALLGAAGLGDIGEHFPDTDERWRDADSIELLRRPSCACSPSAGCAVVNVDCTVIMEAPKLGAAPRARSASASREALGARRRERVNVKATTGEGIGFVGRGEGVAALAIASLERALGLARDARDRDPRHAQRRAARAASPRDRGRVGIYACGPTVYSRIHVGNARPFVVFSLLKRFLEHEGYDVTLVINVTDVNDKIYDAARAQGRSSVELAARDDRRLPRRHRRARARPARPRAARVARRSTRSSSTSRR